MIRPFSPPPMCASNASTKPRDGEKIIVIARDRSRITGQLKVGNTDTLQLVRQKDGEVEPIQIDNVKAINLPTTREWIDIPHDDNSTILPIESRVIKFQIHFSDEDEIKGKTLGFNVDGQGLYLFPTQEEGNFSYLFVPHSVISEYRLGDKIGTQLVSDKVIDENEVKSALKNQEKIRNKPLGRYFLDRALVTRKELEEALDRQSGQKNIKLGEILVQENYISEEQLKEALEQQNSERSKPLGKILIELGNVKMEEVQRSLAKKMGIPFVNLDEIELDITVLDLVSREQAEKNTIMPLHIYGHKLVVVMIDPLDWKLIEEIRFICNMEIIPVMAFEEDIKQAINKNYVFMDEEIDKRPEIDEKDIEESYAVSENKVVRLASHFVMEAYKDNVSDIHIESQSAKAGTLIRFRKDGSLRKYREIPLAISKALISRYKVMAGMDMANKHTPQDGKIKFSKFSDLNIELRLITIPTSEGNEDMVIRLLAGGAPKNVDQLHMSRDNLECTKFVLKNPHGLFLICGPTGSGKTTTMHSLLSHLNTPDRKIWTVEDPVEITQHGIRQVTVNRKVGVNFAGILKSFLRADPDIIMIGEMRDVETTTIAIQAALTGHLVLSTLHTNSAIESAVRLLEMGMDPYNFSDALLGILAQRLVGQLCPHCKISFHATEQIMRDLVDEFVLDYKTINLDAGSFSDKNILDRWYECYADDKKTIVLYKKKDGGCTACDKTGYKGRIGLHEMMMASHNLRLAIYRQAKVHELLELALTEGMKTLKQDGIEKVLQGYTDLSQVRKVCARL